MICKGLRRFALNIVFFYTFEVIVIVFLIFLLLLQESKFKQHSQASWGFMFKLYKLNLSVRLARYF